MKNYVEMFTEKAQKLRSLMAKYGDKLTDERRNEINILIKNTLYLIDGRFEALDYDVRNQGIMNYSQQLEAAEDELEQFEKGDIDM